MKVVVIGIANQQTSLPVGAFPIPYESVRFLTGQIRHTVGGVGFNVSRALSALGNMVALASPLGEDYPAAMIDAEAFRYNISTHLCGRELARTPRSVVLFDDTGRRQVNVDLTDASGFVFQPADLAPDLFRAKLVVLGNVDMVRPLIAPLRDEGKRFAVDLQDVTGPDNPWDTDFLQADYLNMSNVRVEGAEREVLTAIAAKSRARVLSMTLGAAGALVLARGWDAPVHVPAPEVTAVNSVGAGDVFWAVMLHHLVEMHTEPVTAVQLACAAGARLVEAEPLTASSDPSVLGAIVGVPEGTPTAASAPEIGWNAFTVE